MRRRRDSFFATAGFQPLLQGGFGLTAFRPRERLVSESPTGRSRPRAVTQLMQHEGPFLGHYAGKPPPALAAAMQLIADNNRNRRIDSQLLPVRTRNTDPKRTFQRGRKGSAPVLLAFNPPRQMHDQARVARWQFHTIWVHCEAKVDTLSP